MINKGSIWNSVFNVNEQYFENLNVTKPLKFTKEKNIVNSLACEPYVFYIHILIVLTERNLSHVIRMW